MPEALQGVSGDIRSAVHSGNPLIQEALDSLFQGDGKLLRPGLLIIASRFGKGDEKKFSALGAAMEILHTATLVHDDVIDDSPLRRGQPAAHVRYGRKDAVLVGDYLLSRCFLLASEYTSPKNAVLLAKAVSTMCSMEIEQDTDRYRADISVRRYLRKILGKTALLFSLACYIGAKEAKTSPIIMQRLRRAGYDIGMAFQIIDDILDYAGDPEVVRKPTGNDIRAGIATLPLICALSADREGSLAALVDSETFRRGDPQKILELTIKLGGVEAARQHARRYTERALSEIARLPDTEPRRMLDQLARALLERSY